MHFELYIIYLFLQLHFLQSQLLASHLLENSVHRVNLLQILNLRGHIYLHDALEKFLLHLEHE